MHKDSMTSFVGTDVVAQLVLPDESDIQKQICLQLASELTVHIKQVVAAVQLLDEGATVPFIARYRKEVTGGLDDVQLRNLQTRLEYLRDLANRRMSVLRSIHEQGKLTRSLQESIFATQTKQDLEDIYLPYKPKRRTKGQIAKEFGLEPLADILFNDPNLDPQTSAQTYVRAEKGAGGEDFTTVQTVLDGVRDILSERWAEDVVLLQNLRQWLWNEGVFQSNRIETTAENDPEVSKFRDYFAYSEVISNVPSHRALAVFRGRQLEILDVKLSQPVEAEIGKVSAAEIRIAQHLKWQHQGRAADDLIRKCVAWTWRVKLSLSIERDLFTRLREDAEKVAIKVFADNLRDLLLAAPAGQKGVMGLDPGIRTGVKVAVVDATGKLLETTTVYPHEPRKDWDGALFALGTLCKKHGVSLIAIGNGTASRETDKLAAEVVKLQELQSQNIQRVVVSEAGASVYSASEFASLEMPTVDVSLRGAASIARRLQDPLAELVKIDPKSIGVGQYQHDVNQVELAKALDAVVEDCVNGVGVDVNTASAPLLARVSGLSATVAKSIVRWRDENGAFNNRQQLLKVSGLGAKTFEQSAGFLRIRGGDNPLDVTGVHPETYSLVESIMKKTAQPIEHIMGKADVIRTLKIDELINAQFGEVTVRDVLNELEKPGRDPRPDFKVARFNDGIEDIADLKQGMVLEGTISNVAAFGAFVDIGVHQDGLIHVSQLANKFVSDAREVVKTGNIVKVRVTEVDVARKRIGLSMRLDATSSRSAPSNGFAPASHQQRKAMQAKSPATSAMADAFAKLQGFKK